jgi:membrane associated rhomboid family serine protease
MVSLYFLGSFMTRLVGGKNLLKVYFIGGIIGNIFYILWAYTSWGNPSISVIGASGAIFAIGGVLTMLRPNLKVLVFPIPAPLPLWVAIIGGFFIISFFPNVAWQAHLGGLISGLIAGYYFKKKLVSDSWKRL